MLAFLYEFNITTTLFVQIFALANFALLLFKTTKRKNDGPQTAEASRGSVASDTGRQTAANTLQILLAT